MAGKDIPEQWNRLQQQQIKALHDTEASIDQWKQFISDFEALKTRLHTLPDKVTHDVMVPFGKMAFMPGQLVHTNEIMVLLGDNWFAERSANQAAEIVDRRITMASKNVEDLEKQKQLLLPRQQFTSELEQMSKEQGETFEIREEYDEEKEKQWKETHRKRVKADRAKQKQAEKNQETTPAPPTKLTDEQLWARLDQLEEIETERKEIQKVGTPAEQKLEGFQYPLFVHTGDEQVDVGSDDDDDDDDDDESSYSASDELDDELDSDDDITDDDDGSDDEVNSKGKLITFTHSTNTQESSSSPPETPDEAVTIASPADIVKQFAQSTKPKSILKKPSSEPKRKPRKKKRKPVVAFQTASDEDIAKQASVEPVLPVEPAFTSAVIERILETTAPSHNQNVAEKQPSGSQRPVSKFKAMSASRNAGQQDLIVDKPKTDIEYTKPVSRLKQQRQMHPS